MKKLENTEKKMNDMITLSSNNLRSLIQETGREFQAEIEKVNKILIDTEKKNENLIKKAIEEVEKKFEARMEKLEKKVENTPQQPVVPQPVPGPSQIHVPATSSTTPSASFSAAPAGAQIPSMTFS